MPSKGTRMVRWRRALALTAAGGLALPAMMVLTGEPSVQALTYDKLKPIQKRLLSGVAAFAFNGEMQQARSQASARDVPDEGACHRGLPLPDRHQRQGQPELRDGYRCGFRRSWPGRERGVDRR